MASFKKLLLPSSPRSGEVQGLSNQQHANQYPSSPTHEPRTPASPYAYPPQSRERQFEQLHETFYSRTLASLRQFRYNGSNESSNQKNRYIDVVEALFSNHRYQISSIRSLSPITPYNEDIADRNIIAQHFPHMNPQYSRLMSTLYQEDVADRNISRSKSNPIYRGPRSSRLSVRSDDHEQRESSSRSKSQGRSREPRTSYPPANLIKARGRDKPEKVSLPYRDRLLLRTQASAPNLSMTEIKTPDLASFPRPPTLGADTPGEMPAEEPEKIPEKVSQIVPVKVEKVPEKTTTEEETVAEDSPVSSQRLSPDSSRPSDAKSSASCRTSKKNVRDLSINTNITAMKKPSIRIEHCAIQPPTPLNPASIAQNASIDEIVHTPLLTVNPNNIAPQPSPAALDIDEILKILKQAYDHPSQKASPLYPTFETLQEIIIREINSHDAFRKVPVPNDVFFTPPSSDDSADDDILLPPPGPSRVKPLPERESPLSRLIRRRSNNGLQSRSPPLPNTSPVNTPTPQNSPPTYANHSNYSIHGTETDRYLSPAKKTVPRDFQPIIPRRRRHTYGQPSTPSTTTTTPIPQQQQKSQHQPQQRPQSRPSLKAHNSSASVSSSSSFSLFPVTRPLPQPRYKSHFKRKSDPVPPSPHFTEFIPTDAATPPIFPSYVRQH
ncbi:conserved hypothetical protein [Talaromyces stipitatus ATCC 10500]|uniref:Uncharacterized protein n=1 Tax=Talaromyces stipitatus (strain ATCC 10500 / CBS 375.48 / QM 6759 / NRRL 1006) TaxID=441959 RepID=B8MBN1_TALSN|nr:uncharacterized protein TSTA_119280 [Talaromyces stipitatus ATCC 10500]EED18164.1 conserved hypothetical protein [Talaromyces stipitatus ATCC 10500]